MGHLVACQVLVFDIDAGLCRRDAIEIELLDLAYLDLVLVGRTGAGDGHLHIQEIGLDVSRPKDCRGYPYRRRLAGRRFIPDGAIPTLPYQFPQRGRRGTADHHLDVVVRATPEAVGCDTARIVHSVSGRIPAATGRVQAADESEGIVDYRDLFMMRSAQRKLVIEAKVHPFMGAPAQLVAEQPFPAAAQQQGKIPIHQEDLQIRMPSRLLIEQIPQWRAYRVGRSASSGDRQRLL